MPPAQVVPPGGTLHFTGTLSNPTAAAVFLSGDGLTCSAPAAGLTLDDGPFVLSAPASLGAAGGGDTYTGAFFDVTVAPSAAAGTYLGTFSILGGADSSAQATVASEDFAVTVASGPVPEAPTSASLGLLLALGTGGVVAARRLKRPPAADTDENVPFPWQPPPRL